MTFHVPQKIVKFVKVVNWSSFWAIWYFTTDAAPDWLPNTMPYALVLLVLIFNVQKLRVPEADGVIFRRGDH